MATERYEMGESLYWAHFDNVPKRLTCPDCLGKKFLTVILGDESRVTIPCATCARGYEPSLGTVEVYQYEPSVQSAEVTGLDFCIVNGVEKREYVVNGGCHVIEENLFRTEGEARVRAIVLAAERSAQEMERFGKKEKPARTWAWHVTYHRGCIKQKEKELEYHRSQLEVALSHKKVERGN